MPAKIKAISPELKLTRILRSLEQELIDASDEDLMQAARDLGMNPKMKGSAAFLGVRYPDKMRMADFFEHSVTSTQIAKRTPGKEPRDD